jgi:glycyl-tRNA synthetase beta chain
MPELLLELFSEEIPARMQDGAAAALARLLTDALAPLAPATVTTYYGPRRIALSCTVDATVPASTTVERGPRASAPPQALEGFLRKHGATRDQLVDEGGHWVLTKSSPAIPAATLIATTIPAILRRFPWPKSMRWGNGSTFTWIRPLRRILCVLDGNIVPFTLVDGPDDCHGLASDELTEGHRFHSRGAFPARSLPDWLHGLRARYVIPTAAERRERIQTGIAALAAAENLVVVPDDGLLDEVAGLVEWPVTLLGRIDDAFMDLPPEVMQVSMRVNQRYFALRTPDGRAAPRFAFAANIEAIDGGVAIIAGNERVLRARFSDARHFWDLDRRTPLADRVAALEGITFHAKLGTQAARVARIEALARHLAPFCDASPDLAARAAHLAKADLTTGVVGEFPELQGVMGGYYATHDNEDPAVAQAIREHYSPKGPTDPVPTAPVAVAVALADKIDQLASFFAVGEVPTGSGDPYALRRAALGVIRIIRENGLRLSLRALFQQAGAGDATPALMDFIADRLRVQLRTEGARHDVLSAVFAAGADDDIVRLLARTEAVSVFLASPDGKDLLAGARRAANILRIEDKKDGPHSADHADPRLAQDDAEIVLFEELGKTDVAVRQLMAEEKFAPAMGHLAQLRPHLDAFFDQVTVNDPNPDLRRNRLRLLARVGAAMALAADFSRIEG